MVEMRDPADQDAVEIVWVTTVDELWAEVAARPVIDGAEWQRPVNPEQAARGDVVTIPRQDGYWLRFVAPDEETADRIADAIF